MKGIPIKFRGRFWLKDDYVETTLADGDFVYGGYARLNFSADDGEGDYIVDKNGTARLVYPDSVAQLIGYGKDGKEIYEGDAIIDTRDDSANFEKLIAKFGTRRACLAFETYIDWFDKPIRNFLTTEQQLKKRADYIKGFVKGQ